MDRTRAFVLPIHIDHPLVIANRFVVIPKKDLLSILDLDSKDMTLVDHPAKGVDFNDRMFSTSRGQNFVHFNYKIGTRGTIPQVSVQHFGMTLFSVDGTGVPKQLNSWIGAHSGFPFLLTDDQIVTIHPTAGQFEFRSTLDGNIISNPPLPLDLDITKNFSFKFFGDALSCDQSRTYSLSRLRWINPPIGTEYFMESNDKKLQLWRGAQEWVVTDCESELELARFAFGEYGNHARFLDNDTIVQSSGGWGFTCRTVSARTGKTLMTWRPNWWAFPLLIFVVLYHFVQGYPFQSEGNWIYPIYDYFGLNWSDSFLAEWYAGLCISMTAFVSTFLLCQAFRYRGYRWDRPSNPTQWKSECTHHAMDVTPISNRIPPGGTSRIPIPGSPE